MVGSVRGRLEEALLISIGQRSQQAGFVAKARDHVGSGGQYWVLLPTRWRGLDPVAWAPQLRLRRVPVVAAWFCS